MCAVFLCAGAARYGTASSTTINQALPERTVDGAIQRDATRLTVAEWLSGGLSDPFGKGAQPSRRTQGHVKRDGAMIERIESSICWFRQTFSSVDPYIHDANAQTWKQQIWRSRLSGSAAWE